MGRQLAMVVAVTAAGVTVGAVAAQAGGGGGCAGAGKPERLVDRTIEARGGCWSPIVAQVDLGDTVTFRNTDTGLVHNLTGVAYSDGVESDDVFGFHELKGAASVEVEFSKAGMFPYQCMLHPQMAGVVVVGEAAGAAAATAATPSAVALSVSDDADGGALSVPVAAGAGGVVAAAGAAAVVARRRRGAPAT